MFKFIRLFIFAVFALSNVSHAIDDIRVEEGDEVDAFEEVFLDDASLSKEEKDMLKKHYEKMKLYHDKNEGFKHSEIIHKAKDENGVIRSAIRYSGNGWDSVYQVTIDKNGKAKYQRFGPSLKVIANKYSAKKGQDFIDKESKRISNVRKLMDDDGMKGEEFRTLPDKAFEKRLSKMAREVHPDRFSKYSKEQQDVMAGLSQKINAALNAQKEVSQLRKDNSDPFSRWNQAAKRYEANDAYAEFRKDMLKLYNPGKGAGGKVYQRRGTHFYKWGEDYKSANESFDSNNKRFQDKFSSKWTPVKKSSWKKDNSTSSDSGYFFGNNTNTSTETNNSTSSDSEKNNSSDSGYFFGNNTNTSTETNNSTSSDSEQNNTKNFKGSESKTEEKSYWEQVKDWWNGSGSTDTSVGGAKGSTTGDDRSRAGSSSTEEDKKSSQSWSEWMFGSGSTDTSAGSAKRSTTGDDGRRSGSSSSESKRSTGQGSDKEKSYWQRAKDWWNGSESTDSSMGSTKRSKEDKNRTSSDSDYGQYSRDQRSKRQDDSRTRKQSSKPSKKAKELVNKTWRKDGFTSKRSRSKSWSILPGDGEDMINESNDALIND